MTIDRYWRCWLCGAPGPRTYDRRWLILIAKLHGRMVPLGAVCSRPCLEAAHVWCDYAAEVLEREKGVA